MFEVTPSKYPNSVEVISETATLPDELEIKAREAVKLVEVIEEGSAACNCCLFIVQLSLNI